jgi:hypothetical protein
VRRAETACRILFVLLDGAFDADLSGAFENLRT